MRCFIYLTHGQVDNPLNTHNPAQRHGLVPFTRKNFFFAPVSFVHPHSNPFKPPTPPLISHNPIPPPIKTQISPSHSIQTTNYTNTNTNAYRQTQNHSIIMKPTTLLTTLLALFLFLSTAH